MAEEYKHEFVDKYPYLVYTAEQDTLVYSDKADTSIDDIGGGGGDWQEYNVGCYTFGAGVLVPVQDVFAIGVYDESTHKWVASGEVITKAKAGDVLALSTTSQGALYLLGSDTSEDAIEYPFDHAAGESFVMPAHDVCAVLLQ